ncbi:hypothetical protein PJI18_09910 [Mycobacterium kansasii]|jgi:hypothetical protein
MSDESPASFGEDPGLLDTGVYRAKPNSARRSPQEKKRLSYDKDRRSRYGESDKGSRKAVPLHKRKVNRANRHRDRQTLLGSTGVRQPDTEDTTDDRLHGKKRKTWRKWPGPTLREAVESSLKGRQVRAGRKKRARASRSEWCKRSHDLAQEELSIPADRGVSGDLRSG